MRVKPIVLAVLLTMILCTLLAAPLPAVSSIEQDPPLKWDFSATNAMSNCAYIDEDSAEVIIGEVHSARYPMLTELVAKHKGRVVNRVLDHGKEQAVTVDVPLASVASFVEEIWAARISNYIEPNFKYEAQLIPDDPYFMAQWGLERIEAPRAWARARSCCGKRRNQRENVPRGL
ncbi:MAG: hypothetical protein WCC63_05710 [Candidatus Bathyarchaeia archaeon]